MLSGETAAGEYPVEAVETMATICRTVEQSPEFRIAARRLASIYTSKPDAKPDSGQNEITEILAKAAYETALAVDAKAIATPTQSGATSRLIARYRPEQPIIAVTPEWRTRQTLLLSWGVVPFLCETGNDSEKMSLQAEKIAFDSGLAKLSDKLVLTCGLPVGSAQPLNNLRVMIMGNVLARGASGGAGKGVVGKNAAPTSCTGKLFRAESLQEAAAVIKNTGGDILVCSTLTEEYVPILRIVKAVICEGPSELTAAYLTLVNPRLVWLTEVRNAVPGGRLESGTAVTVDSKSLLVYEGAV
jgi:pyruvate kinase